MRRQGVKDLPSAIAIAESLVDYRTTTVPEKEKVKPRLKKKFERKPEKFTPRKAHE